MVLKRFKKIKRNRGQHETDGNGTIDPAGLKEHSTIAITKYFYLVDRWDLQN